MSPLVLAALLGFLHEVYAETEFGTSDVRRAPDDLSSPEYKEVHASLGVVFRRALVDRDRVSLRPLLEAGYGFTGGSARVAGSSRQQGILKTGLRLDFLRYGLLAIEAGPAVNRTRFTFGAGTVPPPTGTSGSVQMGGNLGVQYCFGGRPCAEVYWGPWYERSFAGDPGFDARTLLFFGVRVRMDTRKWISPREQERVALALAAERDRATALDADLGHARERLSDAKASLSEAERALAQTRGDLETAQRSGGTGGAPSTVSSNDVASSLAADPVTNAVVLFNNEAALIDRTAYWKEAMPAGIRNPVLELVVDYLVKHRDQGVCIHGYANETGPAERNLELSEKRARVVEAYLLERGVQKRQIVEIVPHGAEGVPYGSDTRHKVNRMVRFERVHVQ